MVSEQLTVHSHNRQTTRGLDAELGLLTVDFMHGNNYRAIAEQIANP